MNKKYIIKKNEEIQQIIGYSNKKVNKYFVIYLSLCYLIVKLIYKYIKSNIILDLIFLYFITLFYYLITVKIRAFKLIFLYSLLPCIFYFVYHIMKYEMDKQNINSSNYYIGRFNRFKKK